MHKPAQSRLFVVLRGIFAVSTASISSIGFDDGVPPLVIAAYRLSFAALLHPDRPALAAPVRRLTRRDWRWALFSGFFLALHFAAWISLDYHGDVVRGVDHCPIWVALLPADLA
jgi:drug/metabolite transporter (DMT)-like permease